MECFRIVILFISFFVISSCSFFLPSPLHRENFLYDRDKATSKIRILIKKEGDNLPVMTEYTSELRIIIAYKPIESVDLFARPPAKSYSGKVDFDDEIIIHVKDGEYTFLGIIEYWENTSFFGYGYNRETFSIGPDNDNQLESGQTKTIILRISTTGEMNVPASLFSIVFPPLTNVFRRSGILFHPRKIEVSYESDPMKEK